MNMLEAWCSHLRSLLFKKTKHTALPKLCFVVFKILKKQHVLCLCSGPNRWTWCPTRFKHRPFWIQRHLVDLAVEPSLRSRRRRWIHRSEPLRTLRGHQRRRRLISKLKGLLGINKHQLYQTGWSWTFMQALNKNDTSLMICTITKIVSLMIGVSS